MLCLQVVFVVLVHEVPERKSNAGCFIDSWLSLYLVHKATVSISVQSLGTGASKDIHGQVIEGIHLKI